jgi:hypothetical protein
VIGLLAGGIFFVGTTFCACAAIAQLGERETEDPNAGYDRRLPSDGPGFNSRRTHRLVFFLFLFAFFSVEELKFYRLDVYPWWRVAGPFWPAHGGWTMVAHQWRNG